MASELFTIISAQGSIFLMKNEFLVRFDWMPAKILTCEVQFSKVADGHIYLDVDPTSFRMICSIMKGDTSIAKELQRISTVERVLLASSANYLGCNDVAAEIERCETDAAAAKEATRMEHESRVDDLSAQLRDAKIKLEAFKALDKLPMTLLECHEIRHYCPGNRCSWSAVLLGGLDGHTISSTCTNAYHSEEHFQESGKKLKTVTKMLRALAQVQHEQPDSD